MKKQACLVRLLKESERPNRGWLIVISEKSLSDGAS
jgi:hypothetical protein